MSSATHHVTVVGLHHDLLAKQSTVRMVWSDDASKAVVLAVPFGCSLDNLRAEAERALRDLSADTATIPVMPA